MRDDIQGGVLATLIAAPLLIVCCGGGVALAAILGAIGGWIGGVGGLIVVLTAVAAPIWRRRWHVRSSCCQTDAAPDGECRK